METNKPKVSAGYLRVLLCGPVVLAGVLFIVLQWGVTSTYSLYGKPIADVRTLYVVLAAAAAGPLFLLACRHLFKGIWIIRGARRAQARQNLAIASALNNAMTTGASRSDTPGGADEPQAKPTDKPVAQDGPTDAP